MFSFVGRGSFFSFFRCAESSLLNVCFTIFSLFLEVVDYGCYSSNLSFLTLSNLRVAICAPFFFFFFCLKNILSNKTKTLVYFFFGRNLASSKVKFRDRAKNSDLHCSVHSKYPLCKKFGKRKERIFFMRGYLFNNLSFHKLSFFVFFNVQKTTDYCKKIYFHIKSGFPPPLAHPP